MTGSNAGQSIKNFVRIYLAKRGKTVPNGQPLYRYATRESERSFLAALLSINSEERFSPTYRLYWAAGFCLFVADTYRRRYSSNWSWQDFNKELEIELPPNDRAELVRVGLDFWERPLRYNSHGLDYLGSLFAEGGLPWRLLQSDKHGFGRAIKAGLSFRNAGQEAVSVIRQFGQSFPQSFQNDDTYQLLASIVGTLKRLANEHELDQQNDPADYLNQYAPRWREQFPLPLEEDDGVALVNEWLVDASVQVEKRRQARNLARAFTCEHYLTGTLESPRLEAQVWLGNSLQIDLEGHSITTTRIELALYEGERLVLKLGAGYGRVEGKLMMVRLPSESSSIRRLQTEKPLLLVATCAGERLDTRVIQSSELDWQHLPAVFVENDGVIRLAGVASVQYQTADALLRVPSSMQAPYADTMQTDDLGGHWYRINESCVLVEGEARYVIEPGKAADRVHVVWQGEMSSRSTLPVTSWNGWPRCLLLDAYGQEQLIEGYRINGRRVNTLDALPRAGSFQVDVLGKGQRVVARRTLGILPHDFAVFALPASSNAPARLIIRSVTALEICVLNTGLRSHIYQDGAEIRINLESSKQVFEQVQLDIRDARSPQGVLLRLPYPEEGVQLVSEVDKPLTARGLTLKDILGITLKLTPPPELARTFCITLELMEPGVRLERQYYYRVQNKTAEVSLYSLYDDMLALLSVSDKQDAALRCRVETSQLHMQFYIYRFEASIKFTNEYCEFFELVDHAHNPLMYRSEGATVMAMQLANPEGTPVTIFPSAPTGVITGFYELPKALYKDGPWLLYPAENSSITFRPAIHVPDSAACQISDTTTIRTLHAAARYYHPLYYPAVFYEILNAMSETFFHSGWRYMAELKENYSHLSLSSLECWKHLARHPEALALAVFRLEITPSLAERLAHELAVIWEVITVAQWQTAVRCYIESLAKEFGLPESEMFSKAQSRMTLLSMFIPVFKDFSIFLSNPSQLLPGAPPLQAILPVWLNELRAQHDDEEWPTELVRPLNQWVQKQESFNWLINRDMPEHTLAVIFMPIFAACMTAGYVRLCTLPAEDIERRFAFRVLSDFDRNTWYEPVYSACLSNFLHFREIRI